MSQIGAFSTASEAAAAVAGGRVTSLRLTKLMLDRIDQYNPRLNAVVTLLRERALSDARRADQSVKEGSKLGLLHGVPVTIKDCFGMRGVRTTAGSAALSNYQPDADAAVVERLGAAGAVILGKTNVPEMAADWQSYNTVFGTTNNPWGTSRTPGGSTGGGAAALAAGLTYLEVGSDIGGSIRVPSHFCGVYGHKPTIGTVSARGHIPPAPGKVSGEPVLSVAGPLARSASDLALAMEVLGGPEGESEKALTWRLPHPRKGRIKDYRIGYVVDDPLCRVSSEVGEPLHSLVEAMRNTGTEVIEGWPERIDPLTVFRDYRYLRYASGVGSLDEVRIKELYGAEKVDDGSDEYAASRAYASSVKEFQDAMARRTQMMSAWSDYFRDVDALIVPVAFVPAFPHDHGMPLKRRVLRTPEGMRRYQELRFWIAFATHCGLPATVAPIGRTWGGLPVGAQIIGPYMEDGTTIDIADKITRLVGGFAPPPGY